MRKFFGSLALIAAFSLVAFADIRLPDTPKPASSPKQSKTIDTRMEIKISRDAKEARLVIPKSQIKQLRAELEELDGAPKTTAATVNFSRAQTVISGLFLSLAFICGGVWLARGRKTSTKANSALIVVGGVLFAGAFGAATFANVGPPPEARSLTSKTFSSAVNRVGRASGAVKVETSDAAEQIELIVPDKSNGSGSGEEE